MTCEPSEELNKFHELIDTQEKFISLLSEELEEIIPLATIHGWRSSRVKEGFILRNKIKELTSNLKLVSEV